MEQLLKKIEGHTILVTGATGLIGQTFVKSILKYNKSATNTINVIAQIRNKAKAIQLFGEKTYNLDYVIGDISKVDLSNINVDYIIHAASQTSSRDFVTNPVETISVAIDGTRHILEFAKKQSLKRFVYLSTMEVYGTPQSDEKIDELQPTNLDTMQVRSCYPESKRMCENLCVSYASEYGIPINVLRLTQTFGPGVSYYDGRVFAEFARCVIENKNITLKTKGDTKSSYLYTEDAISAILKVMTANVAGEVFNVANENTYCSIYEMAKLVAQTISKGSIDVVIAEDHSNYNGYAPTLHMNLDTSKLCSLGWKASTSLTQMFVELIHWMREHKYE